MMSKDFGKHCFILILKEEVQGVNVSLNKDYMFGS